MLEISILYMTSLLAHVTSNGSLLSVKVFPMLLTPLVNSYLLLGGFLRVGSGYTRLGGNAHRFVRGPQLWRYRATRICSSALDSRRMI